MTVDVVGPAWAREGLGQRNPRYPLAVEGPVMRAVEQLVPGLSSQTRYARYFSLYAATAAEAERGGLDDARCRDLLRRAEVLLAAVQIEAAEEAEGNGADPADALWPHGHDGVRPRLSEGSLALGDAADRYSPRHWGFWAQYGGPARVLGLVDHGRDGFRPGRHGCPDGVRDLLAPLLALAATEAPDIGRAALAGAGRAALGESCPVEREWLVSVLTATEQGVHEPPRWGPADRTRRATLRTLGRAVDLHGGDSCAEAMRSAVVFGPRLAEDPVLASIREAAGWRGLLLRHYSVSAWRRLWADLVGHVGGEEGESGSGDMSAADLRDWLADQVPGGTVSSELAALGPLTSRAGHPERVEPGLLEEERSPWRDVRLLLAGGLRSREGALGGDARAVFLGGRPEFLDPRWVEGLVREYGDRPVRDLAARLVDDMLAQSRRVALRKLRPDPATGGLKIFSRLHMRNDRYFKSDDESDAEIGTRIPQLRSFAVQLGLFAEGRGSIALTDAGRRILDLEVAA
ncbi:hypothetical protein OOK31_00715 [Streptomyces sp. NBC_00249]|uniref:hypothetical protein n=1 Tax=Streptomyces sp. NBC_00249 TaxID=2975690 RepID=UPI00225107D4|nr:hypothetical protein [Streptomyces sp. NBC_00249]MCX5192421.1 hypothetical protein [Streptomyces sp. NBC_00249]